MVRTVQNGRSHYDEVAGESANIAKIGKVNVDEGELAAKYNIMSIPTLIVIKTAKL